MSMDRIAVMLAELTSNTSAIIHQFNGNPRSFNMDAFIEYLDDSTDQAARLVDQSTNFADFGKFSDGVADWTDLSSGGLKRSSHRKLSWRSRNF